MRSRFPRPGRSHGLRAARRGVAAVEFALTAPVLVFLLLGMYDLSMGWITSQRLATATFSVGQVATMLAVQPDGKNWLGTYQAWQAATAINAALPETRLSGAQYTVVMSEITFATDQSCAKNQDGSPSYCIGTVLWSKVVLSQGSTTLKTRKCGRQDHLPNTAPLVQSGLPEGAFQQNPMLVVDMAYTFTPLFLSGLLGQFPMTSTIHTSARSGDVGDATDQIIGYGDGVDAQGKGIPDAGAYCPAAPATPS